MNYKFAEEIKARLLEQHASLWMEHWTLQLSPEKRDELEFNGLLPERSPLECGTVGCIAGHCCMVGDRLARGWDVHVSARRLLDLSKFEAWALFHFNFEGARARNWEDLRRLWGGDPYAELRARLKQTIPGTLEYAQVCADALDLCMERHRSGEAQAHDQELRNRLNYREQMFFE